jgi:hypothetical protein
VCRTALSTNRQRQRGAGESCVILGGCHITKFENLRVKGDTEPLSRMKKSGYDLGIEYLLQAYGYMSNFPASDVGFSAIVAILFNDINKRLQQT